MKKIGAKADIAKIATTGERFEMADSVVRGLRLRVSAAGVKTWSLLYRKGGAFRRFELGDFPDLKLADAREDARAHKREIKQKGADPQKAKQDREAHERAARAKAAEGAKDETVESLSLQCIETLKLRPATRKEWARLVKAEIAPAFPGRLAKELTRPEIKAWTRKLAKRNGWIANRTFSLLRRVYSWAASDDVELVGASPLVGMKKPFKDETESERVLTAAELRSILRAFDALDLRAEGERAVWGQSRAGAVEPKVKTEEQAEGPGAPYVDACRLLLLTGVRRSAVIGAKRGEFEGIDTKSPQWVVPGGAYGRSKNQRPHVVPLSEPALEIVRRRLKLAQGEFLFPVRRLVKDQTERDRAMTWDSHFIALLKDTANRIHGSKLEPWKAHGFRASIATNSRERLKVSGDVVGAILGHKKPGAAATRIYDRSELLDEKRAALIAWAAWLDEIKAAEPAKAEESTGAKVLPMRARA